MEERVDARRRGGYGARRQDGQAERLPVRSIGDVLSLLELATEDITAQIPSLNRARTIIHLAQVASQVLTGHAMEERMGALEQRLATLQALGA